MGQGRFPVPQRGRKREWYLMKGCMKDYSNLLDSNRERVAFIIFCVLLFFQKITLTWKRGWLWKNYFKCILYLYINKSLHFTRNTFSKHFWLKKRKFISWFEEEKLDWCHTTQTRMASWVSSKIAALLHGKLLYLHTNELKRSSPWC